MCRLCDSAAQVAAAARDLTDAINNQLPSPNTGNGSGLRHARRFRVDPVLPDEFQQQLDRLKQPRLG